MSLIIRAFANWPLFSNPNEAEAFCQAVIGCETCTSGLPWLCKRHRISGEEERVHLNAMLLDFFQRHLGMPADNDVP